MEAKTKDLWVYVETKEDGSAKNVGLELLTPGRDLANKQGRKLVAVVIGNGVDTAVNDVSAHGADQVIVIDAPEFKNYTTDAYTAALLLVEVRSYHSAHWGHVGRPRSGSPSGLSAQDRPDSRLHRSGY